MPYIPSLERLAPKKPRPLQTQIKAPAVVAFMPPPHKGRGSNGSDRSAVEGDGERPSLGMQRVGIAMATARISNLALN